MAIRMKPVCVYFFKLMRIYNPFTFSFLKIWTRILVRAGATFV